jgi:hypothetical protein
VARSQDSNEVGESASAIGARAGAFLEINYAGASKDKRIARDLGISPQMARLLRQGRGWTVARFDQVLRLWPAAFRDFVFPPTEELYARLDRLADELAGLRAELRADIAALRADVQNLRGK